MFAAASDRFGACCTSSSLLDASLCNNLKDIPSSFSRSSLLKHRSYPLPVQIQTRAPWRHIGKVKAVIGYPPSICWWKKGEQLSNLREITSSDQFYDALHEAEQQDKLVVVDFYSTYCRACKAMHPKVSQLAAENPNIEMLTVNFQENIAFCRSLKVAVLPFFHFYRGSEGRVDAFSCSLSKIDKLRAAVAKYQGDQHFSKKSFTSPYAEQKKDLVVLPTLASMGAAA